MHISINGKMITPLRDKLEVLKGIRGLRKGDILIITHDCEVDSKTEWYAQDRGIKIIRAD